MTVSIGVLLLFATLVTACTVTVRERAERSATGTPESTEVSREPTPEPTATPDEVSPTATATARPTPTATPEPTPTPTATPEPTPTPTPSPTPTPEPTATPAPTPAPDPTPDPPDGAHPVQCSFEEPRFDDDLQSVVREAIGNQESGFGIVVQNLTTGARAEINPNQSFYGASLYKAAVMYEVLRQVEAGRLSLDQMVTIDEFYADQDLGTLDALGWGPGTRITVRQALEASITVSDNATAYLLADLAGWGRVDETLGELGATNTRFVSTDIPTTAGDQAIIFQAIACSRGVTPEHSQLMIEFLARQSVNNRLPLYLPAEATVAHKTGNWENANHDVGIVFGPDADYVIAVMSSLPGAENTIAQLSRDVYDYFHEEADLDADG